MISPIITSSLGVPEKPRITDENPACSLKRVVAQHDGDHPKRCHGQSRRTPLDPLSAMDLNRVSLSADSHYSFLTPSVSDLRALLLEQPVNAGPCGLQATGTLFTPVSPWSPTVPPASPGSPSHSNLVRSQPSPPSPDKKSSRVTVLESSTSTWDAPDFFQSEPTTSMTKPLNTSRKPENHLQPIRSRTNSMPSVRRPPEELWRSDSLPAKEIHPLVDAADSSHSTPPGLRPPQPDLRRSSVDSDPHSPRSLSLSLALGSQPLRASEHAKAVPPIGAERSRALSMMSHRNSLATQPTDRPQHPLCSSLLSPRLQAKWKNDVYLLDTSSLEKAQALAGDSSSSKEDLERLLYHVVRNKYAPKIISPLSPLRTATPAFDLSTDPEYQLRMPSLSNNPSPRYSKCPPKRVRTVCDSHQTFDWDTTCMHCQECKRDTIGKRLLAFRYRQHQTHHVQRTRLHTRTAGLDDDHITLASRIREAFAYVMDDEEKSLWEEIAAVTGAGPLPLTRVCTPCAAAAHDEGMYDDYMEISEDGLRMAESATLFCDVTVY